RPKACSRWTGSVVPRPGSSAARRSWASSPGSSPSARSPPSRCSMKPRLTEADFQRAAAALEVPVNVIKAVTQVEARGRGFLSTGEPVILFERHIFRRETDGRFDRTHPDLSNPIPGGYGPSSAQHSRLQRAARLDREAALRSASWGMFQIMGFNFERAGHPTLQSFINAMYRSEGDHLDAF